MFGVNADYSGQVDIKIPIGFTGSERTEFTFGLQTVDATTSTIATITPSGTSVTWFDISISARLDDLGTDKKVPASDLSLASLTWEFSELITETNSLGDVTAIDFSLNTTTGSRNPTADDTLIQFDNHIDRDDGAQLKFDVIIDNYEFSSSESILVLGFKIQSQGDVSQDGQTVSFGDGFFHSEDTASDDNGEISVGLSQANEDGNGKLYLAYEQFTGKMIHDPTIGVGSSPDGGVVEDTDQNLGDDSDVLPKLSKGSLITPTILATIVFLGIPVIIYSFKRNS